MLCVLVFKIVRSRLGSFHPEAVGTESEPSSTALRGDAGCEDRFFSGVGYRFGSGGECGGGLG